MKYVGLLIIHSTTTWQNKEENKGQIEIFTSATKSLKTFPTEAISSLIARIVLIFIKFIYSEKATQFCKIFTLLLTTVHTVREGEDFAKFCGLLRIHAVSDYKKR